MFAHNCPVRVAKLAAAVDIGRIVKCHWKLAVVVHRMNLLTYETAATPGTDGVGSLCPDMTPLPGYRPERGDCGQSIVAKTLRNARWVCWQRGAMMPERAKVFSSQLLGWNWDTRTRLSKMKGTDLRYNSRMSPVTQFEMKRSRKSCLQGMFVADADSAIDH